MLLSFSTDIRWNARCMSLSVVQTYSGPPPDVHWQKVRSYTMNSIVNICQKYRTHATFWNILWVIPRRTRQPLDCYAIAPDVCPLDWTSTTFWAYKYPLTPPPFHTISTPQPPSSPLGCQQAILWVFVRFRECFGAAGGGNSYSFASRR